MPNSRTYVTEEDTRVLNRSALRDLQPTENRVVMLEQQPSGDDPNFYFWEPGANPTTSELNVGKYVESNVDNTGAWKRIITPPNEIEDQVIDEFSGTYATQDDVDIGIRRVEAAPKSDAYSSDIRIYVSSTTGFDPPWDATLIEDENGDVAYFRPNSSDRKSSRGTDGSGDPLPSWFEENESLLRDKSNVDAISEVMPGRSFARAFRTIGRAIQEIWNIRVNDNPYNPTRVITIALEPGIYQIGEWGNASAADGGNDPVTGEENSRSYLKSSRSTDSLNQAPTPTQVENSDFVDGAADLSALGNNVTCIVTHRDDIPDMRADEPPFFVPERVSMYGDDIRHCIIEPLPGKEGSDLFHVNSLTFFYGLRFMEQRYPSFTVAYPSVGTNVRLNYDSIDGNSIDEVEIVHSYWGYQCDFDSVFQFDHEEITPGDISSFTSDPSTTPNSSDGIGDLSVDQIDELLSWKIGGAVQPGDMLWFQSSNSPSGRLEIHAYEGNAWNLYAIRNKSGSGNDDTDEFINAEELPTPYKPDGAPVLENRLYFDAAEGESERRVGNITEDVQVSGGSSRIIEPLRPKARVNNPRQIYDDDTGIVEPANMGIVKIGDGLVTDVAPASMQFEGSTVSGAGKGYDWKPIVSIPAPASLQPSISGSPYVFSCSNINGPYTRDPANPSAEPKLVPRSLPLPYETGLDRKGNEKGGSATLPSDTPFIDEDFEGLIVDKEGAGGGILADGRCCVKWNDVSRNNPKWKFIPRSPQKSMLTAQFTQINQGGPGFVVTNSCFTQFVSSFTTFSSISYRCIDGGFALVSNSVSDFGYEGLVAEGRYDEPYTGSEVVAPSAINIPDDITDDIVDPDTDHPDYDGTTSGDETDFGPGGQTLSAGVTDFFNADAYRSSLASVMIQDGGFGHKTREKFKLAFGTEASASDAGYNGDHDAWIQLSAGETAADNRDPIDSPPSSTTLHIANVKLIPTKNFFQLSVDWGNDDTKGSGDENIQLFPDEDPANKGEIYTYRFFLNDTDTDQDIRTVTLDIRGLNGGVVLKGGSGYSDQIVSGLADDISIETPDSFPDPTRDAKVVFSTIPQTGAIASISVVDKGFGYVATPNVDIIEGDRAEGEDGPGGAILNPMMRKVGTIEVQDFPLIAQAGGTTATRSPEINTSIDIEGVDVEDLIVIDWKETSTGTYLIDLFPTVWEVEVGAEVNLYKNAIVNSSGHSFEYCGSGVTYNAIPRFGGVPDYDVQTMSFGAGNASVTGGDERGVFRVGDVFRVNQITGEISIDSAGLALTGLTSVGPFRDQSVLVGTSIREVTNNVSLVSESGRPQNTVVTAYALKRWVDGLAQSDSSPDRSGPISVRSATTDELEQGSENLYLTPETLQKLLNGVESYGGFYIDTVGQLPPPGSGASPFFEPHPNMDIEVAGANNTRIGLGRSNSTNFANVISYTPPGGTNPVPMINFASTLGGPSWIIQGGSSQANFFINVRKDFGNDNIYSLFYVDKYGNPVINGKTSAGGGNTPSLGFNTRDISTGSPKIYQVHFEEDSDVGVFHIQRQGGANNETRIVIVDENGDPWEIKIDTASGDLSATNVS